MKNMNKKQGSKVFFERMDDFLTKYGHESSVILRKWAYFWQNMGMTVFSISKKNQQKGQPIDFFVPYYRVVLTELTFFLPSKDMTE